MKNQLERMKSLPELSIAMRKKLLKKLAKTISSKRTLIISTISKDFQHRCDQESALAEIMICLDEIKHTLKHLDRWVLAKARHSTWKFYPSKVATVPQALGVVGIISPWNYPLNLTIVPLVSAIAAGNRAMVKPSEITAHTAELIKQILDEVFEPDQVSTYLGDLAIANQFSELAFDHIFFTGSTRVGKIIMRNASENLTPVTLELGGKSPVIIDDTYDLKKAAKSIVAGKLFNAGQSCIAPDYVLINKNKMDELSQLMTKIMQQQFPGIHDNPDYSCIVNSSHYERLDGLLTDLNEQQIIRPHASEGSDSALQLRKFKPVIVKNATPDNKVMQSEIFGPILPLVAVDNIDEAINFVNGQAKPLTLYVFSNNKKTIRKIQQKTTSGSLAINETLIHFAQEGLAFGGVGASGMGSYHGYSGFCAMSHMKSVYFQSRINLNDLARAPFTKLKKRMLKLL